MRFIAVSQRVDLIASRNEMRDALDQRIIEFILECDFLPLPVPNRLVRTEAGEGCRTLIAWLKMMSPDGFLLSGGNDIGAQKHRDLTEKTMLKFASERRLPVLGICRGMQMLAVNDGSELKKVVGHVNTVNTLKGEINGKVNSYHQYSIQACPESYSVTARSNDGEIEAIRHKTLPWEGWMWHPERDSVIKKSFTDRFKKLIAKREPKP